MSEPSIAMRRDVALVCAGKLPSTGLNDKRYVLPGDANNPAVRIWPGLRSQRTVVIGKGDDERTYPCICSIRESQLGPVFVLSTKPGGEERTINVAGRTMTACVRTFLGLLADDAEEYLGGQCDLGQVKGPQFFGFRTKAISERLNVDSFPGQHHNQTCTCPSEDFNDIESELFSDKTADSHLNVRAAVRWNGIVQLGETCDAEGETDYWKVFVCGATVHLRDGFTVSREVLTESGAWKTVFAKVLSDNSTADKLRRPMFECSSTLDDGTVIRSKSGALTTAAMNIMKAIRAVSKHTWAGEFFGFHLPVVQAVLSEPLTTASAQPPMSKRRSGQTSTIHPVVLRLSNILRRGGGPTSSLTRVAAQVSVPQNTAYNYNGLKITFTHC